MAKRLSEDEIKWILSVESSQAQQEVRKLTKENSKLTQSNKECKKEMINLIAQGKKESAEFKNLEKAVKDNNKEIDKNKRLINGLTDRMKVNELTMGQLKKRAKELQTQLDNTSKATHPEEYAQLEKQLRKTRSRMSELKNSGEQMQSSFKGISKAKAGVVAASVFFLKAMKDGVVKIKEFEQSNADLAAVLGTTRSRITDLTEDAKRLGATTEYTASQVTNLQTELAKLGFNKQQIRNMTEPILLFATATSADLPEAAKLAGAALRSFEMTSEQTERAVSAMAVATTKTALDFRFLETAMSTIAPVARALGFTIEDTVALLGTLANSGFDASTAATSTRNILLNLADSSGQLAKALGKPVRSLDQLVPALIKLKEEGVDLAEALELTDKRSVAAFNTFLSGAGTLTDLRDSITDVGQEMKNMQKEKLDTLHGSIKILESAWEGLMLAFSKSSGFLKKSVDFLTSILNVTTELISPAANLTKKYTDQLEKVADLEVNTAQLANRYEELKAKSELSKDEQTELNRIISSLRESVPGLTVEFDQYGQAISINTDRVWEFIKAEKELLKEMNSDAITQETEKLEKYKERLEQVNSLLASKEKLMVIGGGNFGGGISKFVPLTPAEIDNYNEELKALSADIEKTNLILDDLTGTSVENQLKAQKELETKRNEFNAMTKEQLQEYIDINKDAKDKYVDIAQSIYKQNFPTIETGKGKKEGKENEVKAALELELKQLDNTHKQRLHKIETNKDQEWKTETEKQHLILTADQEHLNKRINLLSKFTSSYEAVNADAQSKLLDDQKKLITNQDQLDKNAIAAVEKNRANQLEIETHTSNAQRLVFTKALAEKEISQKQYENLITTLTTNSAQMRLAIEEAYLNDINDLELKNGRLKAEAVKKANAAVLAADQQAANARASMQLKLDDLLKDFKGQFNLTTVEEDKEAQLKVLEATYQARLELAQKHNLDTVELKKAYHRAEEQLEKDSQNRINQIRLQYGFLSKKQQYDLELSKLKDHLDKQLISQEDYEKGRTDLGIEYLKEYFDYYSNLFSGAIQSLQQAEMDNIDARYDVEIEAAKGNKEEVERLENEKAQKKLEIQKKYADVNFAIKASEIIASTAVAIMTALEELGPIAGPIAAGLIGATGVAQLASANAEREKVKNLTISGTSASSSGTGARVATGREKGGKIDVIRAQDKKLFPGADYNPDARGFIDKPTVIVGEGPTGKSKEWVASNAAVENPTIAPILNILDQHQQAGDIATIDMNHILRQHMAAGFVSGGSISTPISTPPAPHPTVQKEDNKELVEALHRFSDATNYLKEHGVSVSLSELERQQNLLKTSRTIGSKK